MKEMCENGINLYNEYKWEIGSWLPDKLLHFSFCLLPSSVWQYCQLDLPTTSLTQQLPQIPVMFLTCSLSFCQHSYVWSAPVPPRPAFCPSHLTESPCFFFPRAPCKGPPFHCLPLFRAYCSLSPSLLLELFVLCPSVVHNPELHDLHLLLMSY